MFSLYQLVLKIHFQIKFIGIKNEKRLYKVMQSQLLKFNRLCHFAQRSLAICSRSFEGLKAFRAAKTAAAPHITHPSIRQAKHSKLDPATCRQMDAARRFSYLAHLPEKIHIHTKAIGNIWLCHTKQHKMLSCAPHSWRSLDQRR